MVMSLVVKRKQVLALAAKYARPGSGSSYEYLRLPTTRQSMVDLKSLIRTTPFVLVGGLATRLYMPERMTLDVDILILVEDEEALYDELARTGCSRQGDLTIGGSTWRLPDDSILDVIVCAEAWAPQAIATAVVDPAGTPTIGLPYLILMKLRSGRLQDLADVTRMLGGADDAALAEVRQVVARYMPDAAEDLESMIALGKLEYQ